MNFVQRSVSLLAVCSLALGGCRPSTRQAIKVDPGNRGDRSTAFIEDDYEGARKRALAAHLPLFVDAWAPWCHTCLSMKEFVWSDPALVRVASSFVWASIDTEKSDNEPFVKKFAMQVWPTLWVIDPSTEKAFLKWPGAATGPELAILLARASSDMTGNAALPVAQAPEAARDAAPRVDPSEAARAWLRGNHAVAEGHRELAVDDYRDALRLAPAEFAERGPIVEALVSELQALDRNDECFAVASREWASLPRGTSRLNVVVGGLSCKSAGPHARSDGRAESDGGAGAETGARDAALVESLAREAALVESLAREAARMAETPDEPILADDRSSLFQELVAFRHWDSREAEAKVAAQKWRTFLDDQAARASSPAARVVFDSHRMEAYDEIGQPELALPMLEQSERDFPADYNAPSRIAKVNLGLERLDVALHAIERAEHRVYGPRKLRVMWLKADIYRAMKKPDDERRVLLEAKQLGERLDLTGGYRQLLAKIETRLRG